MKRLFRDSLQVYEDQITIFTRLVRTFTKQIRNFQLVGMDVMFIRAIDQLREAVNELAYVLSGQLGDQVGRSETPDEEDTAPPCDGGSERDKPQEDVPKSGGVQGARPRGRRGQPSVRYSVPDVPSDQSHSDSWKVGK